VIGEGLIDIVTREIELEACVANDTYSMVRATFDRGYNSPCGHPREAIEKRINRTVHSLVQKK
jgi:hypothetical protein